MMSLEALRLSLVILGVMAIAYQLAGMDLHQPRPDDRWLVLTFCAWCSWRGGETCTSEGSPVCARAAARCASDGNGAGCES
jgi:hypothetical protein